ncbi:MAG: type IV secretory system conjugative DNA transfer family protein [Streptosporangiaceae bacterium]
MSAAVEQTPHTQQTPFVLARPSLALRMIPPRSGEYDALALQSALSSLVPDERRPIALELVGKPGERQLLLRATTPEDLEHARAQLHARFPQALFVAVDPDADPFRLEPHEAVSVIEMAPGAAPYLPLQTWEEDPRAAGARDPLLGLFAALCQVPQETRSIAQIALVPAPPTWSRGHQRKSIEHALEPERLQRQMNMTAARAAGGAGTPSAATIILLGMALAAFWLYQRFQSQIPAWARAAVEGLVHLRAPTLSGMHFLLFWGALAAPFVAALALFILYDQVRRRLFPQQLYDMRLVTQKTTRMAFRVRIRIYCIGPGSPPQHLINRKELLRNWRQAVARATCNATRRASSAWSRVRGRPIKETWRQIVQAASQRPLTETGSMLLRRTSTGCQRGAQRATIAWQQWQAPSRWHRAQGRARRTVLGGSAAAYRQFNLPGGGFFKAVRVGDREARRLLTERSGLSNWRCGWDRGVFRSDHIVADESLKDLWRPPHPDALAEQPLMEQRRARSLPLSPSLAAASSNAIKAWRYLQQAKSQAERAHIRNQFRANSIYAAPLVGECSHAGYRFDFAWPRGFLERHTFIGGKSGEGKTSCMEHLASLAMQEGPCIAFGPHGDFIEHLAALVPEHRTDDVVYIDLADLEYSIGLNPLDWMLGRGRDKSAADTIKTLSKIWSHSWGSRMEAACEKGLLTLLEHNRYLCDHDKQNGPFKQHTLLDLLPILTSQGYCHAILQHVDDPFIVRWWYNYFEPLGTYMRLERIDPVLTKMAKFESHIARRILGQPRSTIDLAEIIAQKKILLVNLNKSVVGEDAARLLGATLLSLISLVMEEQGALPESARVHLPVFVDEFQFFEGWDYSALAELRKYGATFILGTQSMDYLYKLDPQLVPTVLANVRQVIAFNMSAHDAFTLHKELGVEEEDILTLDPYMCYIKLTHQGQRQPTFSLNMAEPPRGDPARLATIRDRSRQRYSRPAGTIEAELKNLYKSGKSAGTVPTASGNAESRDQDADAGRRGGGASSTNSADPRSQAPGAARATDAPEAPMPRSPVKVLATFEDQQPRYRERRSEAERRGTADTARGTITPMMDFSDVSDAALRAMGVQVDDPEGGDDAHT